MSSFFLSSTHIQCLFLSLPLCFQGPPCRASLPSSQKLLGHDPPRDLATPQDKGAPLWSHSCPHLPGGEPSLHLFGFTYRRQAHSPVSDSQSLVRLLGAFGPNPTHLCSYGYLGTLYFQCSSCVDTIYNGIHAVQARQLILHRSASGDIVQNYHLEKSTITVSLSVGTKYQ